MALAARAEIPAVEISPIKVNAAKWKKKFLEIMNVRLVRLIDLPFD